MNKRSIPQNYPADHSPDQNTNRIGFFAALLSAVLSLVTFGFAYSATPISGFFCLENCAEYPYLDTFGQYPKDFRWLPLAILLVLSYLVLMAVIHTAAPQKAKVFSLIGLCFALLSAGLLLSDYFIQFTVVPVSLKYAETEGLALFTQYNVHGIFIALEELGYLLMGASFLFMSFTFSTQNRLERLIRWTFMLAFGLTVLAAAYFALKFGMEREYGFEVTAISIAWLTLLVGGLLLSTHFRRRLKKSNK